MEKQKEDLLKDDKVCYFTSGKTFNSNEILYTIGLKDYIEELETDSFSNNITPKAEDRLEFFIEKGSIIERLPYEYKQKVIAGENFSVKVIQETIYTYYIKNDELRDN